VRFNSPFPIMEPREECGKAIEEELLAISATSTLKAKSKKVVRMFGSSLGVIASAGIWFPRGLRTLTEVVCPRERCMTYLYNEATVAPD
jgi:hypothetical protein